MSSVQVNENCEGQSQICFTGDGFYYPPFNTRETKLDDLIVDGFSFKFPFDILYDKIISHVVNRVYPKGDWGKLGSINYPYLTLRQNQY